MPRPKLIRLHFVRDPFAKPICNFKIASKPRQVRSITETSAACRLTTSWRNASGHGVVAFAGRQLLLLHRLVLEVRLGRELAEGEQANQACQRPACINPYHLYMRARRRRSPGRNLGLSGVVCGERPHD